MDRPPGSPAGAGRLRRRGQRGASAVEYALIAVLVAVVIIAAVSVFGGSTRSLFEKTCNSLPVAGATC